MLLLDSDELFPFPFPLFFVVVAVEWAALFVRCWALWPLLLPLVLEEEDDWRWLRKNESRRDPLDDEEEEVEEDDEDRFESDMGP